MNKYKIWINALLFASIAVFISCTDVLDKQNKNAISNPSVYSDPILATAFVNSLYNAIPGWDVSIADASDEAYGKNAWNNGSVTPDAPIWYWPYTNIRNLNTFMENIVDDNVTTLDPSIRKRLTGEVKFIRAYIYFELVKRYGGVPLLTTPQKLTDDLQVTRTSTKECFDFIFRELEEAEAMLPNTYDAADLGRVTRLAARAFRGRVLLTRASAQYNPSNSSTLWQNAYDVNKAAKDSLLKNNYSLFSGDYGNLILSEMNSEVVFAVRYYDPGKTHNRDASMRPITWSQNTSGGCHPTQEVVDRFPLTSGKTVSYTDYADVADSWKGRDNRFVASIVYNGSTYFNTTMELNENAQNDYAYSKNVGSRTGYYCKKGINQSLSNVQAGTSGTDFIDIRLAEVMMNYAEAAVELNKLPEAFDILKSIRARAGISETSTDPDLAGMVYGLDPNMNQDQMRQALRDERFIEFLYEQKRLWDIRRWRIEHIISSGNGKRSAMVIHKNDDGTYTYTALDRDLNDPMVCPEKMYFLPMSQAEIRNNPKLEQTKDWGGTFDPLAGM